MRPPEEYVTDEAVKVACRQIYPDLALKAAAPFIVEAAYKDGYAQAIADVVKALNNASYKGIEVGDAQTVIERWAKERTA